MSDGLDTKDDLSCIIPDTMRLSRWLAEKLPTGKTAPAIASCQTSLAKTTSGDERAVWHLELWKIYEKLASGRPFFSYPFRRLGDYHLDQALLWRRKWPEPLGVRASMQIEERDFPNALRSLEQYVESEREWLKRVKVKDSERLKFCRYLVIGGNLLSQFGRFVDAIDWFTRAREELESLPADIRYAVAGLEDGIFEGVVGCLLLEFRYEEALNLIRETLQGALFQTYESRNRHELRALDEVLGELAKMTQEYEFSKPVAELRTRLMEEIQRCDSSETARRIHRDIVTAVNSTEVNLAIQKLAEAILVILEQEREELERTLATVEAEQLPTELLTEIRKSTREIEQTIQESVKEQREIWDALHAFQLRATRFSLRVNSAYSAEVRDAASRVYEVPAKYGLKWWYWGVRRFIVQIFAVSYLLEEIGRKVLVEKSLFLVERLNSERLHLAPEDVIKMAVAIIVFIVGQFVENRIDRRTLKNYKDTLVQIVGDRFTALWTTHNFLLKTYAMSKQTEEKV